MRQQGGWSQKDSGSAGNHYRVGCGGGHFREPGWQKPTGGQKGKAPKRVEVVKGSESEWMRKEKKNLRCALLADADFGQTDFGHLYLTDFGPNLGGRLWPSRFWPKLVVSLLAFFFFLKKRTTRLKKKHRRTTPFGAPKGEARKGGRPRFSRFFFTLPPLFCSFFFSLSGDLLVKCAHLRSPVFKNTTKIPREHPQEKEGKNENCGGRVKKREILGGPGEGRSRGGRSWGGFNFSEKKNK